MFLFRLSGSRALPGCIFQEYKRNVFSRKEEKHIEVIDHRLSLGRWENEDGSLKYVNQIFVLAKSNTPEGRETSGNLKGLIVDEVGISKNRDPIHNKNGDEILKFIVHNPKKNGEDTRIGLYFRSLRHEEGADAWTVLTEDGVKILALSKRRDYHHSGYEWTHAFLIVEDGASLFLNPNGKYETKQGNLLPDRFAQLTLKNKGGELVVEKPEVRRKPRYEEI